MRRVTSRLPSVLGLAFALLGAMAGEAAAQATPPPPAPAPVPAPAVAPTPPPDLPTPPGATNPPPPPAAVIAPATPLPLPPTVPPPASPPAAVEKPLSIGGALRFGVILQDPRQPKKMNEFHLDQGNYSNAFELRLHGDVTDIFSWTANFNALLDSNTLAAANVGGVKGPTFADFGIEDLIAQAKIANGFQIWAGRLLVPSDRANFSGPFFMSPWNYPGFYKAGPPIGPMEGPNGRNQGITVWGNLADDKFKYFAGIYGIDQGGPNLATNAAGANPFYSARLSYTFQGSEPGYFGSSTYYGEKSVTTLGVGGQYQKNGSTDPTSMAPKDTFIGMADLLTEQAVAGTGTFTFEGQFYAFNKGYQFSQGNFSPHEAFYLLFSYLTPQPVGIGMLQPLIRCQQTVDPAWTIVDAALAYVVKEYDARLVLTYEHIDTGTSAAGVQGISNGLQFGVQLQK